MASNLGGFPKPFQPLREPLRSLIGKYEAGLARDRSHSRSTLTWICNDLEGFFYDHPKVKRPEQILVVDIEDWRLAMLAKGVAWNSVRRALGAVGMFYNWLRKEQGILVDNPVPPSPPARPALRKPLAESQVSGLHPDLKEAQAHSPSEPQPW